MSVRSSAIASAMLLLATAAPAARPARAEAPAVGYDARSFLLKGQPVLIRSAVFHYFRCPRALWEDRMQRVKLAGYNAVETAVPWNRVEPEEGRQDPGDIEEWIDLAGRLGLLAVIRAGPFIDTGWDAGGFPSWLAGRDIGWRTGSPACAKWSKRWLKIVLSSVAPRQFTEGGPVVLVQLESDYDLAGPPGEEMKRYMGVLVDAALGRDITVPIITSRTRVVRDRSDGKMRRMIDACAFGAGDGPAAVERGLAELRHDQPDAPARAVLAGGGDALAKTAIGSGAAALTDEAAPVTEAGGLAEGWDAAKLLGDFLGTYGALLVRAAPEEGGRSDTRSVSVRCTAAGPARFLFARNETNRTVTARVSAPGGKPVEVALGPREAAILVAGAEAEGLAIDRCGARVQGIVRQGGRRVLLLADGPGPWPVSARLDNEPVNATVSWGADGRLKVLPRGIVVWGQPRARAARTWIVDTSRGPAIVSTGGYFLRGHDERGGNLSVEVDALPGRSVLRALMPESATRLVEIPFWTRPLPFPPVRLDSFRVAAERPGDGEDWTPVRKLVALGELGHDANGFFRYRARFEWRGEEALDLGFYGDDPRLVLVNGVLVPELPGSGRSGTVLLARVARKGGNSIEILLENRGRPEAGPELEAAKGLARANLVARWSPPDAAVVAGSAAAVSESGGSGPRSIEGWEFAPRLVRGWERGEGADWTDWKAGSALPAAFTRTGTAGPVVWFRTPFSLAAAPGWNVVWKLVLDCRHDARIFLNGVRIGDHSRATRRAGYYLADPYLKYGGDDNILAIAVIRGDAPLLPLSATVEPYREFSTYTHRLEIPLGKP